MFKSMRLKNFKAYKDSGEVPLAPLTVIVGANNSGKSTLFHALLALAQTAQGSNYPYFFITKAPQTLITRGPLVDLNGFYDIVHRNGNPAGASFEISLSLEIPYWVDLRKQVGNIGRLDIPDRVAFSFGLAPKANAIEIKRSTFWFAEKRYLSAESNGGLPESELIESGLLKTFGVEFTGILPCLSVTLRQQPPQEIIESYTRANIWMNLLDHIRRIGPLRMRVPWYTSVGASVPAEFGIGGENLLAALDNAEPVSGTNKTLLQMLNGWMSARKILKDLRVEADKAAQGKMLLGDEWNGSSKINVAAMGEGISQILPIVARSLLSSGSECLLVEQPEIHLHPGLQAELADLFIEVVKPGRLPGRRQLLVETHSEHFVLRVRRRIAEGSLNPDQVAILFVEKINGESKVRRLDLNSRGHFSDWPKGFFDEAYQEAMALATAASKKG